VVLRVYENNGKKKGIVSVVCASNSTEEAIRDIKMADLRHCASVICAYVTVTSPLFDSIPGTVDFNSPKPAQAAPAPLLPVPDTTLSDRSKKTIMTVLRAYQKEYFRDFHTILLLSEDADNIRRVFFSSTDSMHHSKKESTSDTLILENTPKRLPMGRSMLPPMVVSKLGCQYACRIPNTIRKTRKINKAMLSPCCTRLRRL
jgi:hypothetical protein